MHALKYEGWRELATFMGESMADVLATEMPDLRRGLVVPVPTTPTKLRGRGYNQAALLADCLAGCWGLACSQVIRRARATASQTALAPRQRHQNVRGAFAPAPAGRDRVGGRHVVLVDDVLTTGATASEAAVTLSAMGATSVTVAAFARALVV